MDIQPAKLKEIRYWMNRNAYQFVDNCDDVNATQLAENAADHFNIYLNDNFDIPEEIFDIAAEVAIAFEARIKSEKLK